MREKDDVRRSAVNTAIIFQPPARSACTSLMSRPFPACVVPSLCPAGVWSRAQAFCSHCLSDDKRAGRRQVLRFETRSGDRKTRNARLPPSPYPPPLTTSIHSRPRASRSIDEQRRVPPPSSYRNIQQAQRSLQHTRRPRRKILLFDCNYKHPEGSAFDVSGRN